jgi:hypothetical protein
MKIPRNALKIAGRLSRESGIPLDNVLHQLVVKRNEVLEKTTSLEGKFTVLGVDKFVGSDWVHKRYDTADMALIVARKLTFDRMKFTEDYSNATVFLAYGPSGNYLGGDLWVENDLLPPANYN